MAKRMAAVTLRPPKTRRRCQRLTAESGSVKRERTNLKQSPRRSGKKPGSCRSHAVCLRPTQELRVVTLQLWQLAQVLFHRVALKVAKRRLTRKPGFLLLSPCRRWQRRAGAFVGWQPDIATIREWVQRLEAGQQRSGRRRVDGDVWVAAGPAQRAHGLSEGCRGHCARAAANRCRVWLGGFEGRRSLSEAGLVEAGSRPPGGGTEALGGVGVWTRDGGSRTAEGWLRVRDGLIERAEKRSADDGRARELDGGEDGWQAAGARVLDKSSRGSIL